MSRFASFLVLFALVFGFLAAPAHAKKSANRIQTTGIRSFDKVFSQVADIDDRVRSARKTRKSGHQQLASALALPENTSFSEALAELKERGAGKIKLVMDGERPTLKATDALPSDVSAALDAVNQATADYTAALAALEGTPATLKKLNKQVAKFPGRFKDEAGAWKLSNAVKRYKQLRKVKQNIEVTQKLPERTRKLIRGFRNDLSLVEQTFGQG